MRSRGIRLNVHELKPTKTNPSILLRAKRSATLILYWNNWCRTNPGPLRISITLAGGAGMTSGPFNGPPNYIAVPGCVNKASPSTLNLVAL